MRYPSGLFLLPFVLLATVPLAAPKPEGSVPFELKGHYIVVQGTAKGSYPLNLMIDTGANYSLLDQQSARKLGLKSFAVKPKVSSFGNGQKTTRRVVLPGLRVGPVLAILPCFEADLSSYKVDAILGMDLLVRANFTIDFVSKQIHFGDRAPLRYKAAFQKTRSGIVATLELNGHQTVLLLDTGANGLFLFGDRVAKWIRNFPVVERTHVSCLEGNIPASVINLRNIRMGKSQWHHRRVTVLPRHNGIEADGTLGPIFLGLCQIHFDFQNNVVSWES